LKKRPGPNKGCRAIDDYDDINIKNAGLSMNEQSRPTNKITYFQTCNNRRKSPTGEANETLKIIQVAVVKNYNQSCSKDG
jgi:hypothetical protein